MKAAATKSPTVRAMGGDLSTLDGKTIPRRLAERLLAKFWPRFREAPCPNPDLEKPCQLWTGATCGGDYGWVGVQDGGERFGFYTHRLAFTERGGVIPPGYTLDHLCRQRTCGEPTHLEPVTRGENVRRGVSHSPEVRARAGKAISKALTGVPRPHDENWSSAVKAAWTPAMREAARQRLAAQRKRGAL